MKRMSKTTKLFSVFMSIVLVFSVFNAIVFAEKADSSMLTEASKSDTMHLVKGDLPISELKNRQLPSKDKPEAFSSKSIENNGHVNRLWEQEETLNEIIFQNRDGTKTLYSFTYPVKYITSDGTIRDKKTNISASVDKKELQAEYAYTNPENDVRVYFPKKLSASSGVLLKSENVEIEMSPVSFKGTSATKNAVSKNANQISSLKTTYVTEDGEDKDAIMFNNVFGQGISVRYASQFDGFKEDIIINKYNGVNEFVFRIKTNGLALIKLEDGNLVFVDPENNTVLASLGNLMLYDSSVDGNGYDKYTRASLYQHYYTVSEAKENNEYFITIHVDEEYLKDEATVYPVYVDPSLTALDENDLVITDPNAHVNIHIQTSYTEDDGNIPNGYALMLVGTDPNEIDYRGLINFNSLKKENTSNPLSGKKVQSANLYIRDLFPSISAMYVGLYPVTVEWSDENIWSSYNSNKQCGENKLLYWNQGVKAVGDEYGITVGHWYYFDVKDYVTSVLNSKESKGLMLKAIDASNEAHTFAGSGYLANTGLRPALVIQYEELNISDNIESIPLCASIESVNDTTAKVVEVNVETVENASVSTPIYYKFSTVANTEYYFKAVGQWTSDATIWIYNDDGRFFEFSGTVPQYTFKTKAAKTYYIRIVGTNTATSGKFLITRDYTHASKRIYKGTMVAYFDKSFMQRHKTNAGAQATISGYFDYISKKMLKYFNVELTYNPEQYSQYEDSFSSNSENNNSFNDFYFDAYRLHGEASNALNIDEKLVYTFVFTGKPLEYTQANEPKITHTPADVDCTWKDNVIFITRQDKYDPKTGKTTDNTSCIKYSAWHELLHNFGTVDQYCPNGKQEGKDPGKEVCGEKYCHFHVENNNSADTDGENELELPYSVYRFSYQQISELCVMYSPKNGYARDSVCGCCIIHVFEKLKKE